MFLLSLSMVTSLYSNRVYEQKALDIKFTPDVSLCRLRSELV